ncbi:MAG: hypothetical protein KGN00_11010 [Chloroflexota bacterium]|nr:hypothetical protein [Chloroflexota bacterium]
MPGAVAIAVYADERDVPISAADRGHEGVACVDDAARALVLLCDVDAATGIPVIRAWAAGLLEFLLYMQGSDGRFLNFISDWSGHRNADGPTSFAGGGFWHARGVAGLARACRTFDDPRARSGVVSGMAHVRGASAPANVRALHILTAIDLMRSGIMSDLRADLEAWCAELVACRRKGVLFDDPDQTEPHLWGHVQEGALAEAGAFLGDDELIDVARESALRYLVPLIDAGFDLPTVQPYGVASAVLGVERIAAVTGEPRFARLAERARAWFHERNAAGQAVYDRAAGRVHDGIDAGILNQHSGAESNIMAAQALLPELTVAARTYRRSLEQLLPVPH